MNKSVRFLATLLAAALMCAAAFSFSGCAYDLFNDYQWNYGVTLFCDYEGPDYIYEFNVVTNASGAVGRQDVYGYFLSVLKSEYGQAVSGDKDESFEADLGSGRARFCYTVRLPQESRILTADSVNEKKGFLTGSYFVEYNNPFAGIKVENTPFYRMCKLVSEGGTAGAEVMPALADAYPLAAEGLYLPPLRVCIAAGKRDKATGGEIVVKDAAYWAQWTFALDKLTPDDKMSYTLSYMVSYGWYLLILLVSIAVVIVILLFAKKKNGKIVNIGRPGYYNAPRTADVFDGYGPPRPPYGSGKPDVFNGFPD